MSAQHTAGPFVVDNNTEEIPFRVYSEQNQGDVAYFYAEKDAELFAASLELLALCERALWEMNGPWGIRNELRAAIAKAKGE